MTHHIIKLQHSRNYKINKQIYIYKYIYTKKKKQKTSTNKRQTIVQ